MEIPEITQEIFAENKDMSEKGMITCPNCGHKISLSSTDYDTIASQVRTNEFNKEITERERIINADKEREIKLIKMTADQEKDNLVKQYNLALEKKKTEWAQQFNLKINEKEREKNDKINEIKNQANKTIFEKQNEITNIRNQIELEKQKSENAKLLLINDYEQKLKQKDTEIDYYKNFKTSISTKMVGENLEIYCQNEFNKIRSCTFPKAYFEKDNDIRTGSKGDFIFRDFHENMEYLSVMIECKNEMDKTQKKHKNEDFFKELDKDRREKNCEFAVLVSMLEPDNDLYNTGIVDVSYRYPKMYVIRPYLFTTFLMILKNMAENTIQYKMQAKKAEEKNIDLVKFENSYESTIEGIMKTLSFSSQNIDEFINLLDDIEKKVKDAKEKAEAFRKRNNTAINKLADAENIEKLLKDSPSLKEEYKEILSQPPSPEGVTHGQFSNPENRS